MSVTDDIVDEMKKLIPEFNTLINPPAKEGEIQKLKDTINSELPSSYLALLQKYNGDDECVMSCLGLAFMDIDEVISEWNLLKQFTEEDTFDEAPACMTSSMGSLKRIPFASGGGGEFLFIDNDPSEDGVKGQVVFIDYGEPEDPWLVCDSFDKLLEIWLKGLKDGDIDVKEDDGSKHFESDLIYV